MIRAGDRCPDCGGVGLPTARWNRHGRCRPCADAEQVDNALGQSQRQGAAYERWRAADGRWAGARKTSRLPQLLPNP